MNTRENEKVNKNRSPGLGCSSVIEPMPSMLGPGFNPQYHKKNKNSSESERNKPNKRLGYSGFSKKQSKKINQ